MTGAWLSLLLFAGWGSAMRWVWCKDIAARRSAEARAERAERLHAVADLRAEAAEETAREWMSHADDLAARIERHFYSCPWAGADPLEAERN